MRLNCIRTNSHTDQETTEVHTATVHWSDGLKEWVVKISPGVTGYESALVRDLLREDRKFPDWCCCGGTKGSCDKLVIPKSEFERLLDVLRLIPIMPKT